MPEKTSDGDGNTPSDPNPGGGQGDKTFTQADVDKIVSTRLTDDRKRRQKEGLSDGERDNFLNQIEGLKRQVDGLKGERDTFKSSFDEEKKTSGGLRKAFKTAQINRAIGDAAAKANAVDPAAVSKLLEGRIRVREVTDDGKPTGDHVVEVQVEVERDGTKKTEWVGADSGVDTFLKSEATYLLKSESPAGAGTPPAEHPTKPPGSTPTEKAGESKDSVYSGSAEIGHLPRGAQADGGADLFRAAGDALRARIEKE